jgi:hypothetical protein
MAEAPDLLDIAVLHVAVLELVRQQLLTHVREDNSLDLVILDAPATMSVTISYCRLRRLRQFLQYTLPVSISRSQHPLLTMAAGISRPWSRSACGRPTSNYSIVETIR